MEEKGIDIAQVLTEVYQDLTKSEKKIATFIRNHPEECAFHSASEIATQLKISEATMVRFARALGFKNYPDFRKMLQLNYRRRVANSERLRSRLGDLQETGDVFEKLVFSEIDYMTQALVTVDRKALQKTVDLISNHKRVFIFGIGPTTTLVDLMEIRLCRFGWQVIPLKTSGKEILEPLSLLQQGDLLLSICFFYVPPILNLVLDIAREKQTPVILLTDTLSPIIGNKADVILAAKRGPMSAFHSLVVPMTIINSILLSIANENKEIMDNLDQIDQYRERFLQYGIS